MKKLLLVSCAMAMVCGVVSDVSAETVEYIQVVYATGLQSSYDAAVSPKHQSIWGTNGATVVTDMGVYPFTSSDIAIDFDLSNDTSDGSGVASAEYRAGTWSVALFTGAIEVFSAYGGVNWYDENESIPQEVRGRGVLGLTDYSFDWTDVDLGGNGQDIGINTVLTALSVNPLTNYQTSFDADSVTVTFWADSSQIPEPVTVVLLGLGGIGVIGMRRRRR